MFLSASGSRGPCCTGWATLRCTTCSNQLPLDVGLPFEYSIIDQALGETSPRCRFESVVKIPVFGFARAGPMISPSLSGTISCLVFHLLAAAISETYELFC